MKKNMNDLFEVCREILQYNLEGFADRDIYSDVFGEPSTKELQRRLGIIKDFLKNELEEDGTLDATLHIEEKLKERISSRE